MSRKDYINIASVLGEIWDTVERDYGSDSSTEQTQESERLYRQYIVNPFSQMLERDNERFDPEKFINYIMRGRR